ncbi:MAG: transcription-repair coupling factor, partial [candidate division Zixibacteria bacterium]|nr:transcription-repair coupling factor [candidate division Zixibacteria bacterium]
SLVIKIEPEAIEDGIRQFIEEGAERREQAEEAGWPLCSMEKLTLDYEQFSSHLDERASITVYPFKISGTEYIDFESHSPAISGLKPSVMRNRIDEFLNKGLAVHIACDNLNQRDRVEELLGDSRPDLSFGVARIENGFVFPPGEIAVLTDHELFGHRLRRRPRRFKEGVSLPDYRSLNPNDYVVHIDFGIGRYIGLRTITVEGRRRDCLYIEYKDDDHIYVPIEQFNRVQKYSGGEGKARLSKLGSSAWEKTVKRARRAVMEMAEELIQIYARRKIAPGYPYPPDTDWMKQLEASFPYEETPDQITALADIKADMHSKSPMDRLICGDVGYGKTELAIRAAFKAVDSGKQVAIIVPTTVLAQQHFETFSQRVQDYPISVEMLSRFVERAKQKKIVQAINEGRVDIVIGTHRLLGKDIQFKDIGLLIVDEEQRFGVTHKEKLKKWRTVVDVMTLTATPIPRTLQFSLLGARDMSLINTPPKDRRPIITEISPFKDKIIIDAVQREIDRGGQVYFVHNRVQSIEAIARYLRKLLPAVSFTVAHGQMKERQLENIMYKFSRGEFQVLVSTTIIESGLDIPSVNTIIINRADKLGLAQLYQLRGRVGRSDRQAYAHFLIPPYRSLSIDAKKRLKAMEEFTALGSGFHLAMRDLEIRGAGNLLGRQQHGFIEEVGFDLYCRLLDEAVAELKGEEFTEQVDTKLTLDCDLYIPESYIPEKDLRVDLYRRLADADKYGVIDSIRDEISDRFGRPSKTVENLIQMSRIRLSARKIGLSKLTLKGEKITAEFPRDKSPDRSTVTGFVGNIEQRIEFFPSDTFGMHIFFDGEREQKGLKAVSDTMRRMAESAGEKRTDRINENR